MRFIREDSGAIAFEAVLLLPILIILFSAFAEFFLAANKRLIVEEAAFAAARSALVYKCRPVQFDIHDGLLSVLTQSTCVDEADRWESAARWALVSASPANEKTVRRQTCREMEAGSVAAEAAGLPPRLTEAHKSRLCYAFEPENSDIRVEWVQSRTPFAHFSGSDTLALRATVSFKAAVASPIGRLMADGVRPDGTAWIMTEASVVLR